MAAAGLLGGAAQATPAGAIASAVAQVAATPNTSSSGDIRSGAKTFGGISFGPQIPPYAWAIGLALIAIVVIVPMLRK